MFDVGISEIAVIAVVALVVIGPERLPKVARTIGTLLGRAQRYVNDVKAEVNREMELEELRKLQTQMQDAARGIHEQVSTAGAEMQSAVHDMEKQLHEGATPAAATGQAETGHAATQHLGLTEPLPAALPEPPPAPAPYADGAAIAEAPPEAALSAQGISPPALPATQPSGGDTLATDSMTQVDRPAQSSLFPEHTVH